MMHRVQVAALLKDPVAQAPVALLRGGGYVVPVWMGRSSAAALAALLDGVPLERPTAADLLLETIVFFGGRVLEVTLTHQRGETLHARITICDAGAQLHQLDARPCDAIATALKAGCALLVDDQVMQCAGHPDPGALADDPLGDSAAWALWLGQGKLPM